MDILVSTPGSPGTSLTENVKEKIILMYETLNSQPDFANAREMGAFLEQYGINWNYTRNILPFLQNCGIVNYQGIDTFVNKDIFTDIGVAFVDVMKSIRIAKAEDDNEDRTFVLNVLTKIEEVIYFECLKNMMQNKSCNYSKDFYDVLCFIMKFQSIDLTEYMLIQYARERNAISFLEDISDIVSKYRTDEISINVKTKTKNDVSGASKSVNSFPYITGNFIKAGIMVKQDDGRFCFNYDRIGEIEFVIKEVGKVWQN